MGTTKVNTLVVKTTKRFIEEITVDITDAICLPFGFKHGDIVISPHNDEVKIIGVAPGNDGSLVLWYTIIHPAIKGRVCYWGGPQNLLDAGFVKK